MYIKAFYSSDREDNGRPRRDYARENRRAIKDLEHSVRLQQEFMESFQQSNKIREKWKMSKFQDIKSKVAAIMVR